MVPFRLLEHLVVVPVVANGRAGQFVLDTGIGLTLLSESFAAAVGCTPDGSTFSGRRMSGQAVEVPLAPVASLLFDEMERAGSVAGVIDLAEIEGIDGFLSLDFFRKTPFSVDYRHAEVVLETPESLAARHVHGITVDVRIEEDNPALTLFVALSVKGAGVLDVEVDMGSDALIIDQRFAKRIGVDLNGTAITSVRGEDETGYQFERHFTTLPGAIWLRQAPSIRQDAPDVIFQKIIHDGLIGRAFLRNYTVTYDLAQSQMLFGPT